MHILNGFVTMDNIYIHTQYELNNGNIDILNQFHIYACYYMNNQFKDMKWILL